MRCFAVVLAGLLALTPQSCAAAGISSKNLKVNGWFPCATSMTTGGATSRYSTTRPAFQCAEVEVPLCHEEICQSDKTINLFVKRSLADSETRKRESPKVLWFLQGGPGFSSQGLENHMLNLNALLDGSVNMYTLDHRGTGRSNFLECQAAQAFTQGSPEGVGIDYVEIPNCIQDILFQIDNHTEAFSVTSAAKDVEFLISNLHRSDADVFVLGSSYGTYWAERVMHLAPAQVKGYILNGAVNEKTATFADWNANRLLPEARFITLCENDEFCSSKLAKEIDAHGSLTAASKALYHTLDTAAPGENACADLLRQFMGNDSVQLSYGLRNYLGTQITSLDGRVVIPALLHRLYNCAEADVAFLSTYFNVADASDTVPRANAPVYDQVHDSSFFLSGLIDVSELWTFPSPDWDHEMRCFENGLFSNYLASQYDVYCLFSGNVSDPACTHLLKRSPELDLSKLEATRFVYPRDKYWKQFPKIPTHASAMVINGKLDFQTPLAWGTTEYENLEGEKIMVTFDYGAHCAGIVPTTSSDDTHCGYEIIASYVVNGGRVEHVNTTCMERLPAFDFADVNAINRTTGIESADELYDS